MKSLAKCEVVRVKNGEYRIQYTPTVTGNHEIILTAPGLEIPGSPFPVKIESRGFGNDYYGSDDDDDDDADDDYDKDDNYQHCVNDWSYPAYNDYENYSAHHDFEVYSDYNRLLTSNTKTTTTLV